ncbi:12386_t:CDS:2 [Cetraspora pellucida]|uniref:12386_t:CDS:1 n=1 Tax=Cetraspora pellucida TaxID=1433469 RepID=A0A9N8WRD6_9GLOM|nr:12386_t:CDS:2 [Cetraspora pellucida]
MLIEKYKQNNTASLLILNKNSSNSSDDEVDKTDKVNKTDKVEETDECEPIINLDKINISTDNINQIVHSAINKDAKWKLQTLFKENILAPSFISDL